MSKNISISDEVYERLKREKGDRSFSELIEDTLETRNRLTEVHGTGILDAETYEAVKTDIRGLSQGTTRRLEDEDL
jgi:predicted CopG family antitoxin